MERRLQEPGSKAAPRVLSGGVSPFVGREGELRRLTAVLRLVADGQGAAVFLTGQPGIGKTRMARETVAQAKACGFKVLEGRAYPLQAGLAYAPILNAFGPLLRSLEPARLAALVDGLPDLGRLFGDLRLSAFTVPIQGLGDPALEKTRLFEAVCRLLERLAQEAPVILFVDDLHWADLASLELLHYLSRGLIGQRTLLLATCSAEALNTSRTLRGMVRSLQRDGLAEEIVVPRLEPDSVGRLASGILGGEAPPDLSALLAARAGGTPLFVEALIAALVDSGSLICTDGQWVLKAEEVLALPETVRHLILERLERLGPVERRVLDLIAVMGDGTSHLLLREASDLEEEHLIEALHGLHNVGLVFEGKGRSDVTYSVAHPLIQEVAYNELSEMVRRRAHLTAIKAIEAFSDSRPETVSRLARHYRGAGPEVDPGRALTVLLAAGERALALYANEEAAQHYEAALVLLREDQGSGVKGQGASGSSPAPCLLPPDPYQEALPRLLEKLGEAWERIGKRGAAVESWNEALALLSEAVDGDATSGEETVAAARLHSRLAFMEWNRGNFGIAEDHLKAGLTALTGREPCQELVKLQLVRFYILGRRGDRAGMADAAAQLLVLADRLALPLVAAEANLVAAMLALEQSDVDQARQRALQALAVSERAQELEAWWRSHAILAVVGMRLGDHKFMRQHAERGIVVARRLGAPNFEFLLLLRLAYASFLSGDWNESLQQNMAAISLARRVGYPRDLAYALAERAMLLALQGEVAESEACVTEARIAFGSGTPVDRYIHGLADLAETALALERGQAERALNIARGFMSSGAEGERASALTPAYAGAQPSTLDSPPSRTSLTGTDLSTGFILLAEAQVAAGEAESALETARQIASLGPAGTPYLTALASRAEGLARQALGQSEDASACLNRAHDAFAAAELPFEAARALLELAEVGATGVRGQGSGGCPLGAGLTPDLPPPTPVVAAQKSLAIFEQLGARRYIDRARRLLRELGISPPPARRTRPDKGVLTGRELAVARLVAQGLTSTEIAERLVLSPLTVNSHLHHIYNRLGIGSRAALARYIAETGLLGAAPENT